MIRILYDKIDTSKDDKKIATPLTPPTTPTEDDKPCSIASKKLSLIETIKQIEEEEPVKEIIKENKSPHGYRFFIKNYIEHVDNKGTKKQQIYNSYVDYCHDHDIVPLGLKPFYKKLEERGIISYKSSVGYFKCISNYKRDEELKKEIKK